MLCLGFDPVEPAVALVIQDIEQAVGTLANVADATQFVFQQDLFMSDGVAIQNYAMEALSVECADEEIALPPGELVIGVECEPRWRQCVVPHVYRRLDAGCHLADPDELIGVVFPSEGDLGPAVVASGLGDVELLTTTRWTVIDGP